MTQHRLQTTFTALRVVTQRLSTIPTHELPSVISSLASALSKSEDSFLDAQYENEIRKVSDGPVLVHKLKTQISALLQDRSPEARYSAVVLIKAIVEVGGESILKGSTIWIKNLTGIIGSPNPAVIKQLCVIALTRIFVLTHRYPSLVREVTTPCLPGFTTACLNLMNERQARASNDVALFVMQAFTELMPRHSALFRPFGAQIKALCLPHLAPTPSSTRATDDRPNPSSSVSESARRLYVLLSFSAPKNTLSEAWAKSLSDMIKTLHRTANLIFRALIEDFATSSTIQNLNDQIDFEEDIQDNQSKEPGLAPWIGINAGIERLDGLIKTLGTFVSTPSPVAVVIPVGELAEVIERVLSALPPTRDKTVRTRPESTREERESLFVSLPQLHVSAIKLCSLLLARMGRDAAAIAFPLMEQIHWILYRESNIGEVKTAAYKVMTQILDLFGASFSATYYLELSSCLRQCCEDVLPLDAMSLAKDGTSMTTVQNGSNDKLATNISHDSKITNAQHGISRCPIETRLAAVDVISSALTHLPRAFLPSSLRQQIDRAAIISNNKEIMFASTMNPPIHSTKPTSTSSLVPFLARSYPDHLEVEAILKPRMPLLQVTYSDKPDLTLDDEDYLAEQRDINDYIHNDPQANDSFDGPASTDPKRQRQPSDDNHKDTEPSAGEKNLKQNPTDPSTISPSPKRQKLAHHEDAAPTLPTSSLNTQQVDPPSPPRDQNRNNNDDPTFLNAPFPEGTTEQPPSLSQQNTQASPSVPITPPNPPDAQPLKQDLNQESLNGGEEDEEDEEDEDDNYDSDDSENFVMPELEMDTDPDADSEPDLDIDRRSERLG